MKFININRLIVLILIIVLTLAAATTYAQSCIENISGSVLRLHILANSNSDADQQLKLQVRNRLLQDTAHLFKDCKSAEDARRVATENLPLLLDVAEGEIHAQGFDYPVKINIGDFAFPTRKYGSVWLPKGNYTALRVEIGKAMGKNWWCVMYPPLCFTKESVKISPDSNEKLKASLGTEEYNLVTQSDQGTVPIEIRFKIVEIFQDLF